MKKHLKKYRCATCGQKFEPARDAIYTVKILDGGIISVGATTQYNAMDCPICGCRILLTVRPGQAKI